MGLAYYYHQRLVLLAVVAFLCAGLFPQALGKGHGGAVNPAVAGICSRTPFPEVCKSTAGRHASKYPVIDNLAVLNMQVEAFSKRTAQARQHVAKSARTIPPAQKQALTFCDTMYMNTQDTIGAAQRAITFKDTSTAKIMLQLAVQDFDSCDRPFTQAGIPNPMGKFDKELNQMANNCMTLANMI
ncbi:hypothetical protein BDA96_09G096100 [Sorghum bicolor]|jgi:pectinesterase inhibitor-like protein|uniref:Pectinesterase inhibitor domain-containing protein n=2 Tax=Sorghum bicolor TaxID=4558 RepID=A0A921QAR3_SORBI|nr:uncharacterized protein LOC8066744 [Sorghum bicolor]EES17957.1 hypothetical protein SORBI_3009G091600 [Sorghum bicolor]KAG0517520.1 hypothetical protein BDA96_09G096100 [Sorghum bicolor]|eukprot:XP_002439527.1 uncharacterized protein LOC8066744 [Sorghum bicolor]